MSDTTLTPPAEDEYVPRQIIANDLDVSFEDAIDGTMVSVEDGQIVEGTVVKVDKDEVLLDIGYKSEGVIPSRELSIRNDVDPAEVVSLGEQVEALVSRRTRTAAWSCPRSGRSTSAWATSRRRRKRTASCPAR
ncbi:MAG: S1 RNA-binding domain-containing protein [Acidimicrobiales bacterium]